MLKKCLFGAVVVAMVFNFFACTGPNLEGTTPSAPAVESPAESATGTPAPTTLEKASADDIEWMSKVIASESGSVYDEGIWVKCTDEERAAVGWTVLNRLERDTFGGTVQEVVTAAGQYAYGQEPTLEIRELAKKLLKGQIEDPTEGATHFFSPISMPWQGDETKPIKRLRNTLFENYDTDAGLHKIAGISQGVYFPSWTETLAWCGELDNVRGKYFMFYRPKTIERPPGYTEFYLIGTDGKSDGYPRIFLPGQEATIIACIVNHEQRKIDYEVVITINKEKVRTIGPVSLSDSEKWQQTLNIRLTRGRPSQQVEFDLYKGNEGDPYSTLTLWVDVGIETHSPTIPHYPVVKWDVDLGDIAYEPSIGPDGTIYVATSKKLYALDQNGTIKWDYLVEGELSYYCVAPDGTIYVNTSDPHIFCAFSPDGTKKWESHSLSAYCMAFAPDGTIYTVSGGLLQAIDSDGAMKWWFNLGVGFWDIAVAEDGSVFAMSNYVYAGFPKLYAISSDGTQKWKLEFGWSSQFHAHGPVLGVDGMLYILTDTLPAVVYAINTDGTTRWRFSEFEVSDADYAFQGFTVGQDGSIYIAARAGGRLYVIGNDGMLDWMSDLGGAKPAVSSGGVVSGKSGIPRFYAINPNGSEKWEVPLEDFYSADVRPAIGTDGTIYVVANRYGPASSKLYAIGADCVHGLPRTVNVSHDFQDEPPSHKWDTIREAVSDATPGSTVVVHQGIYYENVTIDSPLRLNGVGMPLVDGGGYDDVICVAAPFCRVSGFQVTGSSKTGHNAGIKVTSSNNALCNIVTKGNQSGMSLRYSYCNTLEDIVAKENEQGIYTDHTGHNRLSYVTVSHNTYCGIWGQPYSKLTSVIALRNGARGIIAAEGSILRNCVMTGNGINLESEDRVSIDSSNTIEGEPYLPQTFSNS